MNSELEAILDLCIDRLQEGQSVDDCLQAFPEYAAELRPLLDTAAALESLPSEEPSQEMVAAAMLEIGRRTQKPNKHQGFIPAIFHAPYVKAILNTLLIVILLFWGLSAVSADSIPGDVLYPVKRLTENVQFALTFGSENKAELRLTFSEERLRELSTYYRNTGQVDTSLIHSMLNEAQIALGKYEDGEQKPPYLMTRAQQVNATQEAFLTHIQSQVSSKERTTVDRAIRTCVRRREKMQRMMDQMMQQGPGPHGMMNGRGRRMMRGGDTLLRKEE